MPTASSMFRLRYRRFVRRWRTKRLLHWWAKIVRIAWRVRANRGMGWVTGSFSDLPLSSYCFRTAFVLFQSAAPLHSSSAWPSHNHRCPCSFFLQLCWMFRSAAPLRSSSAWLSHNHRCPRPPLSAVVLDVPKRCSPAFLKRMITRMSSGFVWPSMQASTAQARGCTACTAPLFKSHDPPCRRAVFECRYITVMGHCLYCPSSGKSKQYSLALSEH